MTDVTRCKHCILPASMPNAGLNDRGVCRLCEDYIKRQEESRGPGLRKEREFEAIIERARGLGRTYDCLIPLSGGKDSTYALYLCDRIYKLKCLCVTFDNGFLSSHAVSNIRNAVSATRADHMMITVNRRTMLDLYRLFLEKTGTFCPACLRGITLALKVAKRYRIPLTVQGTGWQVRYLSSLTEVYQEAWPGFFGNVVRGEAIEREIRPLLEKDKSWDLDRLAGIAARVFKSPRLARSFYVRLYDYFDPDYDKIYETIKKEMGWTAADQSNAEHLDCELHGVAGFLHHLKFPELTGHTIHRAGLVRMGKVGRDAALAQDLEELARAEEPAVLERFLREMDMTKEEFLAHTRDWRTVAKFRMRKKYRLRNLFYKLTRQ